ncbi:MAG TPA: ArdC-like ssDNA-binding domain-containing protein [Lamprocystis sp. (in: g-proteobacteria)]|nr:ArdC-like ssDNA-binding domain-containing protein [Lamprocystis sp. (in: g-proteobacteria)]
MAEREEKVPYYEQVANKLIEQLQAGTAPRQKPWAPGSIHPKRSSWNLLGL